MQAASAEFRRRWAEHEVRVRRNDRKTLLHPREFEAGASVG